MPKRPEGQPEGQEKRFPFTVARLENVQVPAQGRARYFDSTVPHLGIRVQSTGKKSFFVLKRIHGKSEEITLGAVGELPIESARREANRWLAKFGDWKASGFDGLSPVAKVAAAKVAIEHAVKFDAAFESYVIGQVKRDKKTPEKAARAEARVRWLYDNYLDSLHDRRVDELTSGQMTNLHAKLTKEKGAIGANRALEVCRAVFRFIGVDDPSKKLKMNKEVSRTRFLQPDELLRFSEALDTEPSETLCDFLTLLLATGVRKSNLYAARWDDISLELGTWTVPDSESKNDEQLTIQLSPKAMTVLQARKRARKKDNPWVFPSTASKTGHLVEIKREWYEFLKRAKIDNFRLHDVRRTCGSYMAISGASLPQIGSALGHQSASSTEVYAKMHGQAVKQALIAAERTQALMMKAAKKNRKSTEPQTPKPMQARLTA